MSLTNPRTVVGVIAASRMEPSAGDSHLLTTSASIPLWPSAAGGAPSVRVSTGR